jgi:Disulphide bond corrector protein DsbC
MKKPFRVISRNQVIYCFVLLALSSCSKPEPAPKSSPSPPATSANFVKVRVDKVDISPGSSAEATVTVQVQSGYHVNANPATDPYLKATEVNVEPAAGLTVGFVKYPAALTRKFAFSDKQLAVYEGDVPIKVLLKADKSATKGSHILPAKLKVQACDNEVCYAPATMELSIPTNVN